MDDGLDAAAGEYEAVDFKGAAEQGEGEFNEENVFQMETCEM